MMRRGFSLVELLVAMVIIPVLMLSMTLMTRTLLKDMPRDRRVVNEQLQLDQILKQLQSDMDQTVSLPPQWQQAVRDANCLILQQTDGVVVYRREGNVILRSGGQDPNPEREWTLPYARLTWACTSLSPEVEAVEVECHVPLKHSKGTRDHFVRQYLYVPGGLVR